MGIPMTSWANVRFWSLALLHGVGWLVSTFVWLYVHIQKMQCLFHNRNVLCSLSAGNVTFSILPFKHYMFAVAGTLFSFIHRWWELLPWLNVVITPWYYIIYTSVLNVNLCICYATGKGVSVSVCHYPRPHWVGPLDSVWRCYIWSRCFIEGMNESNKVTL